MLLKQMEYFQAVVECGNFYRAAEKCLYFAVCYFTANQKAGK